MIPRGLCRPEKRDLPCINAQRPSLDFTGQHGEVRTAGVAGREVLDVVVATDGTERNSSTITPAHTRRIHHDLSDVFILNEIL